MKRCVFLLALAFIGAQLPSVFAQGTAFSYQGRLFDSNGPANGGFDFVFTSFPTNTAGLTNGGPVTNLNTGVTNGLFSTTINFGPGPFTGGTNWLQIAVRTNGSTNLTNFIILLPRQLILPVPYAVAAETIVGGGGTLTGLNASQLSSGTVSNSRLAADVAFTDTNQTFTGTNNFAANLGLGTTTPWFPLTFPSLFGDKIGLFGGPGNHYGLGVQSSLLQIHASGPGDSIAFGYGNSASMTETMRITGSGNVGIGNPIPGAPLDVLGNFQVNANGTVESTGTANGGGSFNGMIESFYSAGDRYGLAQLPGGVTALYTSGNNASSSIQLGKMTGPSSFTPQLTIDHAGSITTVSNLTAAGNITATTFSGDGSGLNNVTGLVPPPNLRNVALLKWGAAATNNSFAVGTTPRGVCYDGAFVWIANFVSGTVTKLDANTGANINNYSAGGFPRGLCFDGGNNIFIANSNGFVTRVNATTGSTVATYSAGGGPAAVCFDGTSIWVANQVSGNVMKLNPSTGATLHTTTVGTSPLAVCFDGTNIWVANSGSGNVSKIDPATGNLVGTYNVGTGPQGICFDGFFVWVANNGSANVTKLDPATGSTVGTYTVGTGPQGVCFDGVSIWVANNGSGNVTRLTARSGAVTGTFNTGANPGAVCFDSAGIWVTLSGSTVIKL